MLVSQGPQPSDQAAQINREVRYLMHLGDVEQRELGKAVLDEVMGLDQG